MVEKLLELLVTKVDADLLERVEFKNLETWQERIQSIYMETSSADVTAINTH